MTGLMTIGEFAAATWLSPKALRLYDERGLLSPDTVDSHSGYRRYSPAQVETARLITLLRRIDMPLELVGEVLQAPREERAAHVARYREREEALHVRRQSLSHFIQHAVSSGSMDGTGQPGVSMFDVATRAVPQAPLLTTIRHTPAKELPDVIRQSAGRLFELAEQRGGSTGELIVIYHGQVGWESDGPIEVCVPIKEGNRAHRREPEHQELFTRVPAEDVQFPRILAAFEAVQHRAVQLGLVPTGPPREVYEPAAQGEIPRCDVALPVGAADDVSGRPPPWSPTSSEG